ncbi:hypothetical protein KIF24_11370 [Micromonospora sp. Llam7]|uniref:hypothetical protein n=1 Tax=Micromonospora tarapacensis TaxID=2835305 RepID=UPI001C839A0A|nr:hypothetical protein [Micromonospora tarapacensis]MBX7266577.1 hypothetical protein [Micromonospora tarapacensis]
MSRHVNEVWLIERHVTDTVGARISAAAQLGVASHTPEQATPAQVAAWNQVTGPSPFVGCAGPELFVASSHPLPAPWHSVKSVNS